MGQEVAQRIQELTGPLGRRVIWISQFVPTEYIVPLYSQAALFICPSIYEPFGIINLEAMACGVPVVGSAVGGIPEVVVDQETGILVPLAPDHLEDHEISAAEEFARKLGEAVNYLLANPEIRREMGVKARQRVQEKFSWHQIARQTVDFYQKIVINDIN
jgi:glycosyltransferase involved in cell wall biosynthesis